MKRLLVRLAIALTAGAPISSSAQPTMASAQPTIHLAVLGGLADVNQYTRREVPFWTQTIPQASKGRVSVSIRPYDQAGLLVNEPFRLLQIGVVSFANLLLTQAVEFAPEIAAPDLAGLHSDMASVRRAVAAFRPYMTQTLRDRYKIELLAIYAYPAQVLFCRNPIKELSDIKGLRVRTSSRSQADFVQSLGGSPVSIPFGQLNDRLASKSIDCAIAGTMSGNGIGLHEVTSHLYSMPVNWALSIFATNLAHWQVLPDDVRQLLQRELPQLEADIWSDSERETVAGFACNTGQSTCVGGRSGKMQLVVASDADRRKRQAIFRDAVLVNWVDRCGERCADVWKSNLAELTGIAIPTK